MKKGRDTQEQVIGAVKPLEDGRRAKELARVSQSQALRLLLVLKAGAGDSPTPRY